MRSWSQHNYTSTAHVKCAAVDATQSGHGRMSRIILLCMTIFPWCRAPYPPRLPGGILICTPITYYKDYPTIMTDSKRTPYITFHVPMDDNAELVTQITELLYGTPSTTKKSAPPKKSPPKKSVETPDTSDSTELTLAAVKKAAGAAKKEHGEAFVKEILSEIGGGTGTTALKMLASVDTDFYTEVVEALEAGPEEEEEEEEEEEMSFAAFKKLITAAKKEHGEDFVTEVLEEVGDGTGTTLLKAATAVDSSAYADVAEALELGPDNEGEEEAEVDVESVKAAMRAYSKEHSMSAAKKLMRGYGISNLAGIVKLESDDLADMFAELQE